MKITLDLADDLLLAAKAMAVRRRTTLKALVEHALRREILPATEVANPDPDLFEVGPLGFLVLKRQLGEPVTLEQIQAIQDEIDAEDLQRAIGTRSETG